MGPQGPQGLSATVAPAPVHGTTSGPQKADNAWATIPEMTINVTPTTTQVDATFNGTFDQSPSAGATTELEVRLAIGGVAVTNSLRTVRTKAPFVALLAAGEVTSLLQIPLCRITGLAPGVQVTVTAQWRAISGTTTARGTQRTILVQYA